MTTDPYPTHSGPIAPRLGGDSRSESPTIEAPRPTITPFVLVAGLSFAAAGLAFDTTFFLAAGAVIFLVGLVGWVVQLLPGRGHVHLDAVEPLPRPVTAVPGTVERLVAGTPGYRFQLPTKMHPISAGAWGGLLGGALMPIPALAYGLLSAHHSIFYPVNLLAGMVLPGVASMNLDEFHLSLLVVGVVIHVAMCLAIGLMLGVMLPTLPHVPKSLAWGGLLMPLLWTAVSFVLMGFVNPVLEQHVEWPWFILSQFAFGVGAAAVIANTSKFGPVLSGLLGAAAGGVLMAVPALLWSLSTGRGVWYPVNLLAGLVVPAMPTAEAELRRFHAEWFVPALTDSRRHVGDFRRGLRPGAAEAAADSRPVRLGRPAPAAPVDGGQLRTHGRRQPDAPARGGLALVHRLPVRLRTGGGGGGGPFGKDRNPPGGDRPGGSAVNRFHPRTGRLLVALLLAAAAGCDWPGKPNPADRPVPPDQVLAFKDLYGQNCAGCHGADGKMGPAPPLNDPLFRALVPEETLEEVISKGRHGTLMPAFARENGGPLTWNQISVLEYEIKGIPYKVVEKPEGDKTEVEVSRDPQETAPAWGTPDPPPQDAPPYAVPKDMTGDATAGKDVFARACAACHGDQGQGVEKDGRLVLTIHDPAFLALISDQALRRTAVTGRADLGMPDYAHRGKDYTNYKPLTSQDVTNLTAFLSSWRPGGQEKAQGAP